MTRRSTRRKKARSRVSSASLWTLGGVLAVAGALALAWHVGLRPEVREETRAEPVSVRPSPMTGESLQDSLQALLESMGVGAKKIRRGTAPEDPGRWQWAVALPPDRDLIRTNLAVTEAVAAWGGRVWEATETLVPRTGAQGVRMALGDSVRALGHLVLEASRERAPAGPVSPRLAIVIDDLGHAQNGVLESLLAFPYPITLSILPGVAHSEDTARRAAEAGRATMLHLPMEPHGYPREDPGPGAVMIEMDEEAIVRVFEEDLAQVDGVTGLSNHMGSAATEDPMVMRTLLHEAAGRGLFFLDSVTTPRSVAARVAAECGVRFVANDLFIDNDAEDPAAIRENLRELARRAEEKGSAVGIGHPHATTLEALTDLLPVFEARGIRIVPVEELAAVRLGRG